LTDSNLLLVSFFAHSADADIADRTVWPHLGQELRHIAEGLDRLANETANGSDPGPISFSPRCRNL